MTCSCFAEEPGSPDEIFLQQNFPKSSSLRQPLSAQMSQPSILNGPSQLTSSQGPAKDNVLKGSECLCLSLRKLKPTSFRISEANVAHQASDKQETGARTLRPKLKKLYKEPQESFRLSEVRPYAHAYTRVSGTRAPPTDLTIASFLYLLEDSF